MNESGNESSTTFPAASEGAHSGTSVDSLRQAIRDNLYFRQARIPEVATTNDWYLAVASTVRDHIIERSVVQYEATMRGDARIVSYLSAEFLLGPHLGINLLNLGIYDETREAVKQLGQDLDALLAIEEEPGLGNGGLGRLAACYMDSLARLQIPAIGYGIRYEFGIFDQIIRDGWQVEVTDKWLRLGNPWEIERPEITFEVKLEGYTETNQDSAGEHHVCWKPGRVVKGVAYDTAISAYNTNSASLLRLWKAEATESFDFDAFNVGDYYGAVAEKIASETISKVLYPNDEPQVGKRLRLVQQYFFVSCSLQDLVRIHLARGEQLETFCERNAIQLNDTHPSIGVAELMRLLLDEHGMGWDRAWEVTTRTFAYTNHTLLPEALEKWAVPLFEWLLPRHLEIIYEINRRFLNEVRQRFPGDEERAGRLSLIEEGKPKHVRMAHLATVGSFAVNGVAALHSELLKDTVLKDLYDYAPKKFHNVTNGVTPRRWIALCNPGLARLITEHIGDGWTSCLEELRALEQFGDDNTFRQKWCAVKRDNKQDFAALIEERTGVTVSPDSLFDIQVKRIHEYKRQHLNVIHIVALYNLLKRDPNREIVPRTFVFGGKAAPGYDMAKLIIKLINAVGEVVNRDPDVAGRIKVVFFPDFNVKNAYPIYPAADLSEQISTAGKEASGTGNMKFSMNGALTVGTLDGANIEIREEVGAENFFEFGLTVDEIQQLMASGYDPLTCYEGDEDLRAALEMICSGVFSEGNPDLFSPLIDQLLHADPYLVLADFRDYMNVQEKISRAYLDAAGWTRMSVHNVARIGKFSSDRAIQEYCERIWNVCPAI